MTEPINKDNCDEAMSTKYPAYWRLLPKGWRAIDTYRVNHLFPIKDDSGRLLHARKKLLVCGTRTGGKSMFKDIQEARDTLTAWLEDNAEISVKVEVNDVLGCTQCHGKGYVSGIRCDCCNYWKRDGVTAQ